LLGREALFTKARVVGAKSEYRIKYKLDGWALADKPTI
jgi:hypothetical protein